MTELDKPAPGIICLGASAGGLRSLEAIVGRLPADMPWPVLISQHLQADRVSQLPEILARSARMPVREAVAGEVPVAGTIYTCPSSHELGVGLDGRLTLRPPASGKPQRIDHLFATASYARPGRTIAVVLSGTGNDGAVGSLVVKLNGGSVLAESDESAEHTGMPAAAQRAGTVDATLAAGEISAVLYALSQDGLDKASATTAFLVTDIARLITSADGTDFSRYRHGTLRRQAEKRRILHGLRDLAEYRDLLANDTAERTALKRSLLVPVTEFFRDAQAWRALEDDVVPILAERARAGRPVRVWCVGCATGEEAYSIAILLAESIENRERVEILGTDLDPAATSAATHGAYDASRMRGVDALRIERFFHPTDHGHRANSLLRAMVQFRVHDATRDEAPGSFDLIICRNLLIYFDATLQAQTITKLRAALVGPQILFLGKSETIQSATEFVPLVRPMRIFRATGADPETPHETGRTVASMGSNARAPPAVVVEEPDAIVLLIDDAGRIRRANERARMLSEAELVGTRLLDLFPRWQGSPVHDAIRDSVATGRSLKVRGAPTPDGPMDVTLERALAPEHGTLLIATPTAVRQRATPDLVEAREDLAATNDELQSANEELAATNEELQATNEELASLNEEFQTTNQTLASTNIELGEVAKSAKKATDLMDEFVQRWAHAIVACDAARRVTVFNRQAAQLFTLGASSIGRPIDELDLGATPAEILHLLERARSGDGTQTTDRRTGDLALTVTHVSDHAGDPLGWVLAWAPVR